MIETSELIAAFPADGTVRQAGRAHELDYEVRDYRWSENLLDIEVVQRSGLRARVQIDLPSSGKLQPWLYMIPEDANDWVIQLLIWLDEEIFTGGLGPSRARAIRSDESYIIVETYGWRNSSAARHTELAAAAGPQGFYGDVYAE